MCPLAILQKSLLGDSIFLNTYIYIYLHTNIYMKLYDLYICYNCIIGIYIICLYIFICIYFMYVLFLILVFIQYLVYMLIYHIYSR